MQPSDGPRARSTVAEHYAHLVEREGLARDPAQLPVVTALDRLIEEIASKRPQRKSSPLGWLFARNPASLPAIRGLYIHGGVGTGKTMLMDIFFDLVPVGRKRRVHFNAFMAEVHDRIGRQREARKAGGAAEDDPIPPVARALAEEAWVLCFDEFSVTDIADAMILSRLFSALFANGLVLVATSNVAPADLYRDGLNRQLFLPFVAMLERHAEIVALQSATDYRKLKRNRIPVYLSPLTAAAERGMDEAWKMVSDGIPAGPAEILVKGRSVAIPMAAGGAARFSFADLCEKPLAARDYLAIVSRYDTIFIDRTPVLGEGKRNEAKRFILLVDTLYDRKARLVMSAEAAPGELYAGKSGVEAFEFQRTASRLIEMQGADWLEAWARDHDSIARHRLSSGASPD